MEAKYTPSLLEYQRSKSSVRSYWSLLLHYQKREGKPKWTDVLNYLRVDGQGLPLYTRWLDSMSSQVKVIFPIG